MAVAIKDRGREWEAGAQALSGQLGKTIQRLRKAYNLSLSELASSRCREVDHQPDRAQRDQSDARHHLAAEPSARRSRSSASSRRSDEEPFIEETRAAATPILVSEDGKVKLAIVGWIKTVEWLQWYDVTAEPGGALERKGISAARSNASPCNRENSRSEAGDETRRAGPGDTLR